MTYRISKCLHLVGLVLWLGPSTGGYMLILVSRQGDRPDVELWLLREFLGLVHVETLGLLLLFASGFLMRSLGPHLRSAPWLRKKLLIVFSIFLPLEAIQLYIYHFVMKGALAAGKGVEDAVFIYDAFSLASFIILAVAVPLVFVLAVFKPGPRGGQRGALL